MKTKTAQDKIEIYKQYLEEKKTIKFNIESGKYSNLPRKAVVFGR